MVAKEPLLSQENAPSLFSPDQLPDVPKIAAGAKAFLHTGKITCKDEERAAAIAEAFLQCGLILPVARRFHISPNTVKAVVQVLEESGKLDDLKQRLSSKLGLLAETSIERANEMLMNNQVPANVLPILMGVAIDKKELLDGNATSRVQHQFTRPLATEDVAKYLRDRGIGAKAIDVKSTVVSTETSESA